MRPIKFRVWTGKKIISWDILRNLKTVMLSLILEWGHRDYIPMQFTWLLDKNGKEIYEDDIVQSTRPAAMKYKVIRDDEVAWFLFEDEFKAWFSPYGRIDVVIIGNIYENPEIIEQ